MGNLGLKTHNTLAQEVFQYDPCDAWPRGGLPHVPPPAVPPQRTPRPTPPASCGCPPVLHWSQCQPTNPKQGFTIRAITAWLKTKKFSTSVTNSDIPWLNNTLKFSMTSSEYWEFKLNNLQKNSQKIWIDQQTNSSSYTDNMQHLSDSVLN